MKLKDTVKFLAFLTLTITVVFVLLIFFHRPSNSYTIQKLSQLNSAERPLELALSGKKGEIKYTVTFLDNVSSKKTLSLVLTRAFIKYPPFLSYGEIITLQFKDKGVSETPERATYNINGLLSGVKSGTYRIRIVDSNGNVIDERKISL